MTSAYVSGGAIGDVLYIKCPLATAQEFRRQHGILFRYGGDTTHHPDLSLDTVGLVLGVTPNGANSCIAAKLIEADDNSTEGHTLANANLVKINGSAQPDGADMPPAISYAGIKMRNITQELEHSLNVTRRANALDTEVGNAYKEGKRDAFEQHGLGIEDMLWFSQFYDGLDAETGQQLSLTQGVLPMIREYMPSHVFDYCKDTNFSGKSWLAGGRKWVDGALKMLARWGALQNKLGICGDGFVEALNDLAYATGMVNLESGADEFGLQITKWRTASGILKLATHPRFSTDDAMQNACAIIEPSALKLRYVTDTMFKEDKSFDNGGPNSRNAIFESYYSDIGLEYTNPERFGLLLGSGWDNELDPA
jgi:hypothetical protein